MNLIKVKDHKNLCRDAETGAVINVNVDEYKNHIQRRRKILSEKAKIDQHGTDINNMKQELCEIKNLLVKILEAQNASNSK